MKKILFAMAALAALTSCQKADLAEQNSVNTNGERVITAYFDNAGTKTTLDENGITPKWAPNDKIMLLNRSTHDEITLEESNISADGKSVTITTTLEGTIYAVYPSTATSADKLETDDIVPVTLSAENQDGTFASANICVAKENDGSLAFKNVTSVLHLTQTASTGVNEIIITTPSADIAGTGTVDMSETTPTLALSSGRSKKIKVKSASPQSDYYIAVAPTTLPAGTAFGFATGSKLGGTNLSEEKTIAANTIYNIGSMDASAITPNTYHEYVEIEMTVNSETKKYKWAKCNIGATKETDYGDYYVWGTTVKAYSAVDYSKTTGAFTFVSSNPYGDDIYKASSWNATDGFAWCNTPFTSGVYSESNKKVFTKYVPESKKTDYGNSGTFYDDKTVLDLNDDVANKVLGGDWRMPTKAEFDALCSLTKEWKTNYNGSGANGYEFTDANSNKIFLPAVGYGDGTDLKYAGENGYYWSSSLNTNTPHFASYLGINNSFAGTISFLRYGGQSVRAVSE